MLKNEHVELVKNACADAYRDMERLAYAEPGNFPKSEEMAIRGYYNLTREHARKLAAKLEGRSGRTKALNEMLKWVRMLAYSRLEDVA